jgi:hypothetical protein
MKDIAGRMPAMKPHLAVKKVVMNGMQASEEAKERESRMLEFVQNEMDDIEAGGSEHEKNEALQGQNGDFGNGHVSAAPVLPWHTGAPGKDSIESSPGF